VESGDRKHPVSADHHTPVPPQHHLVNATQETAPKASDPSAVLRGVRTAYPCCDLYKTIRYLKAAFLTNAVVAIRKTDIINNPNQGIVGIAVGPAPDPIVPPASVSTWMLSRLQLSSSIDCRPDIAKAIFIVEAV